MSESTLKKIWYLLYVAAIIGASPEEMKNIPHSMNPSEPDTPYLGLGKTPSEFVDYPEALAVIGKQFEDEISDFPAMASYLRFNIIFPSK